MPKVLATLRETRSRIKRALVCIAQARDEIVEWNMPLEETATSLNRALEWVEEAINEVEASDVKEEQ